MSSDTFFNNPHYVESVRLLVRLHELMRDGDADSEAADAVRDEMDVPWRHLNEAEVTRLRGLSADLYTLEPESPIEHPATGGICSNDLAVEIEKARRNRDPDRILRLLREHSENVSADVAAYMRGRCWGDLGDPEISLLFFREAAHHKTIFAVGLLHALHGLERIDEALELAKDLLGMASQLPPYAHLMLPQVFVAATRNMSEAEARPVLEQAARMFEDALSKVEALPEKEQVRDLTILGKVQRAMCYQQLGQLDHARKECEDFQKVLADESASKIDNDLLMPSMPAAIN